MESQEVKVPKLYFGYTMKQLICCFICYFVFIVFGIADSAKGVYLPAIKVFYQLKDEIQGLLVFTSSFGYVIFSMFVGYSSARYGIACTLMTGVGLFLLTATIIIIVRNIWVLLTCLIIVGIGGVFLDVGTNTWATVLFTQHKAIMMNLLHFFYGVGATIGPTYAGIVSQRLNMDYRGAFIAVLVVCALSFIAVLFTPKKTENSAEQEVEEKVRFVDIIRGFKSPAVILFGLTQGCIASIETITINWSAIYFQDRYGWDPNVEGAHFLSIFFLLYSISRLLSGFLIDKVGETTSTIIYSIALVVCYVIGFPLKLKGVWLLEATGFFVAPLFPTILTIAMIYIGKDIGKYTCIILLLYNTITPIMQLVVGVINSRFGREWGYPICIILGVCIIVNAIIMKLMINRKEKTEKEALLVSNSV